jgi:uncharacterized cupredoxin-like copper-binding protein
VRVRTIAAAVACSAVAAPFALASEGAKTLNLSESEWDIAGVPKVVKAGAPLRVTITNKGGVLHELVLEHGGCAKQCVVKLGGHSAELENLQPGTSRSTVWTISKPGTYTFTCRKPGHWKAGMRKSFTVV